AIQSRNSCALRALSDGIAPMMPALHASITSCGPDTRNIGAATTGSRSRAARAEGRVIDTNLASRGPAEATVVQHHGLPGGHGAAERRFALAGAPYVEAQLVAGPHRTREAQVQALHPFWV